MNDKLRKIKNAVFVAFITEDKGENFDVWLVNNSDRNYNSVKLLFESQASIDDDLWTLGKAVKDYPNFQPYSAIKIDNLNYRMLDFLTWYHVDLVKDNAVVEKFIFAIKGPSTSVGIETKIPILNKAGRIIDLDKREGEIIEEAIKGMDMESKYYEYSNKQEDEEKSTQVNTEDFLSQRDKEADEVAQAMCDNLREQTMKEE